MSKKSRRLKVLVIALALMVTLVMTAACGGGTDKKSSGSNGAAASGDKVVQLKWAHSSPATNDRLTEGSQLAIEKIKKDSNGTVVFTEYPASQLGAERDTLEGVSLGTVDLCVISTGPLLGFCPEVEVLALPYSITDRKVGQAVYDGEFGQKMGKLTEEKGGWVFLGWGENSLRLFSNNKRPIHTPADMKGLKIRTMENAVHQELVKELGASPTAIAIDELYTALQQGTVDGQENGIALTYNLGFYEQLKYLTEFPHIYDPYIVCMSQKAWDSLSADQQKVVQDGVKYFCEQERLLNEKYDEENKKKEQDAGIEFYTPTEEEGQQFIDATKGVEQMIRKDVGDELVDEFKAAIAEAEKQVG